MKKISLKEQLRAAQEQIAALESELGWRKRECANAYEEWHEMNDAIREAHRFFGAYHASLPPRVINMPPVEGRAPDNGVAGHAIVEWLPEDDLDAVESLRVLILEEQQMGNIRSDDVHFVARFGDEKAFYCISEHALRTMEPEQIVKMALPLIKDELRKAIERGFQRVRG